MIIFETSRLLIRQLEYTDFEAVHTINSNPNVMLHVTGKSALAEETRQQLDKIIKAYQADNYEFIVWGVLLKSSNEMIGTCALFHDEGEQYEIGYRFAEAHWGQGYASEVARGLVEYARGQGITQLMALCTQENFASQKVLQKAGFQLVGDYYNKRYECIDLMFRLPLSPAKE